MLKITFDSYRCGQAEAHLNIVPGLMPSAYVLGLLEARWDAKSKKHPNKNKPGFDWVEDPGTKGGGYYRKAKTSTKNVAAKVAAASVLVGAGAALIAANRKQTSPKPPNSPVLPILPTPTKTGINKKAVAGAGLGVLSVAGAGATAVSRRQSTAPQTSRSPATESKTPKTAKVKYKQVGDPWSEYPPVEDPWAEQPNKGNKPSSGSPAPNALPPAKYQPRYPAENDPWEGSSSSSKATVSTPMSTTGNTPALPPAKPVVYKRKLVPKTPKLRQNFNKFKAEQTGLKKAEENLEYGQYLQSQTHSPVSMQRGVDVEMNAAEKIANLKARSPERTPAGLATIRGKNRNTVRVRETAGESRNRKEKEVEKAKLLLEAQDLMSPVETDVESSVSPSKEQDQVSDVRARKRQSRAENRQLKKELGELTLQTAGKTAWKKSRQTALNAMVPGLGDAVDTAYMLKGNKDKFERWSNSLKEAGDTPITRRQLFRKSGEFVAKETSRNPKSATDELKRGAEVSQDFFNKIFDKNDKIILQGGTNRMGSGDKIIQLSPEEFNRITRDYTQADRRALRSFLDLIRFPLP